MNHGFVGAEFVGSLCLPFTVQGGGKLSVATVHARYPGIGIWKSDGVWVGTPLCNYSKNGEPIARGVRVTCKRCLAKRKRRK